MVACVLGASFSFQWLFRDKASSKGYAAWPQSRPRRDHPPLWFPGITNGLGMAERRGRIDPAGLSEAMNLLRSLPLEVDQPPPFARCASILETMRAYRLAASDATYLDLAHRHNLSLATKDRDLLVAAPAAGIPLFAVAP